MPPSPKPKAKPFNDIRVVAFDCDGVMFDTARANRAYYNQVLARFQLPPMTPEQFRYTHAHTAEESIAYLFRDTDFKKAADAYRREIGYLPFLPLMKMEPHLTATLKWLRRRFPTAIATNRMDTMLRVLESFDLTHLFDYVVTALDVPHPKPRPDALLKIADHFGMPPDQVLYIGDSDVDEAATQAAGMPFVAFGNSELNALAHISKMSQLRSLI